MGSTHPFFHGVALADVGGSDAVDVLLWVVAWEVLCC